MHHHNGECPQQFNDKVPVGDAVHTVPGNIIESEQRYEEFMDMLHAGSERRREFTRGVLRTAAGVALGNKISDKLKKKD